MHKYLILLCACGGDRLRAVQPQPLTLEAALETPGQAGQDALIALLGDDATLPQVVAGIHPLADEDASQQALVKLLDHPLVSEHAAFTLSLAAAAGVIGPVSHPKVKQAESLISYQKPWRKPLPSKLGTGLRCRRLDGIPCVGNEAGMRSIVWLPAGFDGPDEFFEKFERVVAELSQPTFRHTWFHTYASKLLLVASYSGDGFSAQVASNPLRGEMLTADNLAIYDAIDKLDVAPPISATVVLNTDHEHAIANATMPCVTRRAFGIARMKRIDSAKTFAHELSHASMSYGDEYVEPGFERIDVRSLDVLTPLGRFDGTWAGFSEAFADLLGIYDLRLSEIIVANGIDNVMTGKVPAGYTREGGMIFGRGTFHMPTFDDAGGEVKSMMELRSSLWQSDEQKQIAATAFAGAPARPNDRIRSAGPVDGYLGMLGDTAQVILMDADKLHHFQPTQAYELEIGWYEGQTWTTRSKRVSAREQAIEIDMSVGYQGVNMLLSLACTLGLDIQLSDKTVAACALDLETLAQAYLPVLRIATPYQNVDLPMPKPFTTYHWRFCTDNGAFRSSYTEWRSFYRSL